MRQVRRAAENRVAPMRGPCWRLTASAPASGEQTTKRRATGPRCRMKQAGEPAARRLDSDQCESLTAKLVRPPSTLTWSSLSMASA